HPRHLALGSGEVLAHHAGGCELEQAGAELAEHPADAEQLVFGGIGVVGLVGFVGFGLSAKSQASDLRSSCAPACAQSDVDGVKRKALFADVSLGIGLVAIGAATYFFIASSSDKDATKVGFAPLPSGGAFSVAGHF
ncbi:MAG: hypothetical protein ACXVCJ_26990, partial [Polyangiales bacterium]